jgi:hypothetical protein
LAQENLCKCAHKMLVKLTIGLNFINNFYSKVLRAAFLFRFLLFCEKAVTQMMTEFTIAELATGIPGKSFTYVPCHFCYHIMKGFQGDIPFFSYFLNRRPAKAAK